MAQREAYGSCPWKAVQKNDPIPLDALASPLKSCDDPTSAPELGVYPQSPYYDAWWQLSAPFRQLFSQELTYVSLAFVLLCGLWVTIVKPHISARDHAYCRDADRSRRANWRAAGR